MFSGPEKARDPKTARSLSSRLPSCSLGSHDQKTGCASGLLDNEAKSFPEMDKGSVRWAAAFHARKSDWIDWDAQLAGRLDEIPVRAVSKRIE